VTGEGGDVTVLDDPHKPEEAQSDLTRQFVLDWHDATWSTRLNDPETGVKIVVMQRLHERDLTGHLLERGGWEHLCLPAGYAPSHQFAWPRDPRTEPGEVLWEKWGAPWLAEKKLELGSYGYAGQYQQRPAPAEGGILKRRWWRYYDHEGELPHFDQLCQSWDMAFKDTDGPRLRGRPGLGELRGRALPAPSAAPPARVHRHPARRARADPLGDRALPAPGGPRQVRRGQGQRAGGDRHPAPRGPGPDRGRPPRRQGGPGPRRRPGARGRQRLPPRAPKTSRAQTTTAPTPPIGSRPSSRSAPPFQTAPTTTRSTPSPRP
jgi:hypothetical protein